jgi:hypothetical protein
LEILSWSVSLDLLELFRTPRKDAERWSALTARNQKYGVTLAGFVLGAAAGA